MNIQPLNFDNYIKARILIEQDLADKSNERRADEAIQQIQCNAIILLYKSNAMIFSQMNPKFKVGDIAVSRVDQFSKKNWQKDVPHRVYKVDVNTAGLHLFNHKGQSILATHCENVKS